jgi:hypothetical protein
MFPLITRILGLNEGALCANASKSDEEKLDTVCYGPAVCSPNVVSVKCDNSWEIAAAAGCT